MTERPILFSAPAATDTKPKALELADHPGTSFAAQEMLRSQHARIEELERALTELRDAARELSSDIRNPKTLRAARALHQATALLTKKD